MAGERDLVVPVVAKVKGLWRLTFLTFLLRHVSRKHTVHVHLNDGRKTECAVVVNEPVKPPSLAGQ